MLEGTVEMGKKAVNTGKGFGPVSSPCRVLLPWGKWCGRKVVGLEEVISLHCWGLTMFAIGDKGRWVTQNQNALTAEVNMGFKVNKIS